MGIGRFITKIKEFIPTDDVIEVLQKLPDDPTLKQISESAGTVGGIIKIVLHITEKIYEAKVPVEKRLSITLMRIMLESGRDSIPFSVSKVKVEEILGDEENLEFENIVLELFDPKYNHEKTDLPDHPVFIKFRNLLGNGITTFNRKHGYDISIPQFLTEFNSNLMINLEEEKANNKDLGNLLRKWKVNKDLLRLQLYLKNARDIYFKPNKIDGKSLSEYYVENKTYRVDKETWKYDEKIIEKK